MEETRRVGNLGFYFWKLGNVKSKDSFGKTSKCTYKNVPGMFLATKWSRWSLWGNTVVGNTIEPLEVPQRNNCTAYGNWTFLNMSTPGKRGNWKIWKLDFFPLFIGWLWHEGQKNTVLPDFFAHSLLQQCSQDLIWAVSEWFHQAVGIIIVMMIKVKQ